MKPQTMQAISELQRVKSLNVEFSSKAAAHAQFLTAPSSPQMQGSALSGCKALPKHCLHTTT